MEKKAPTAEDELGAEADELLEPVGGAAGGPNNGLGAGGRPPVDSPPVPSPPLTSPSPP